MNKPNTDSKLKTVGWDSINWQKVDRYVFKLQKRIYAASRHGDIKTVRKLQKTLIRSWSNKVLAVRKVTQENRGKKTAGVDGKKNLSPEARMKLIGKLKLTGKSKPTRRIWIPKPGREEKRPLGIPTIEDRALQGVIKATLEPEWEARFEPNSFGFRPGRSCQDAIWTIKNAIKSKTKYVLDADIAKCFDCINHKALLDKLNTRGKVRQQIKSWLKSGVIDQGVFTATSEGTPQGGVLSPLLANIALHGIEEELNEFAKTIKMRYSSGKVMSQRDSISSLTFVRYADDFVVIHQDIEVIHKSKEIIANWLKDIGLELKPCKTRIAHTLHSELSEDGIVGFDFLGYNIRQIPAGKHTSSRNGHQKILGFNTTVNPSKSSCKRHQESIKSTIKKHKSSPQAHLINELNPIIRGWCNFYRFSNAQAKNYFTKQDHQVYLKLRAWGRYRCGNLRDSFKKYYMKYGANRWTFATNQKSDNPLRLLTHSSHISNTTDYVRVKGNRSPFDGDLVYWSTRMGRFHNMPTAKAIKLKKQKGKCNWCGLHFRERDVLEEDHVIATALGGKNVYENLQLLHAHCHDEKNSTGYD